MLGVSPAPGADIEGRGAHAKRPLKVRPPTGANATAERSGPLKKFNRVTRCPPEAHGVADHQSVRLYGRSNPCSASKKGWKMNSRIPVSLIASAMAVSLAACGGGGGGGAGGGIVTPPPPPPPPPPYASNCSTTPSALSCQSGLIRVAGPQVGVRLNGAPTDAAYSQFTIDRRGTSQTSDDLYAFRNAEGAAVIDRFYTNPQSRNDGLGSVRVATNVVRDINGAYIPGDSSTLTLYDITSVLQGGLDYVQLGRVAPNPANGAYTYFAVGQTPVAMVMPTTGTAQYQGGTRGEYINGAGVSYRTASDLTLTANFGTGAVTGSASNFRMIDDVGAPAAAPYSLNFDFSANISGSSFSGTATGSAMTGSVSGAFYGAGSPTEAALGFSLNETGGDGKLVGVGGLRTR